MSQVECRTCGYKWNTKSKLLMVTCVSCGYKTPNGTKGTKRNELKGGKTK